MTPDRGLMHGIRQAIEAEGDRLADLHLWRLVHALVSDAHLRRMVAPLLHLHRAIGVDRLLPRALFSGQARPVWLAVVRCCKPKAAVLANTARIFDAESLGGFCSIAGLIVDWVTNNRFPSVLRFSRFRGRLMPVSLPPYSR